MLRVGEQPLRGPRLDDLAKVHHPDPMRDIAHHAQIVRDEDKGNAQPFLQIAQQVQNPRLYRHVERRHRLIQHHDLRIDGYRTRNADTLALPP